LHERPGRRWEHWLTHAAAAAIASAATWTLAITGKKDPAYWQIFEYDLFWQVQAGREILAGHGVQRVDQWSFTAAGRPWFNFQWLATVLDYVVFRIGGGYGALSWLRSVLVAAWIFTLAYLVGRSRRSTDWLIVSLVIPWVYVASSFRLQMRPDLFATCLFAALVASWLSSLSLRTKRITGVGLLLLWANLHAWTFPFGMLFFAGATIFGCSAPKEERITHRLLWVVAPEPFRRASAIRPALTTISAAPAK
jgi:hypothetical protein